MRQIIRYGLVGVSINLVLYMVYLFLVHSGGEPKRMMSYVYVLGVCISFFGHRQLTFSHEGSSRKAVLRYAISHLCGYAINFILLYILVDRLGYPHQFVQVVSIFVVAGFMFLAFKFFVFPKGS